MKPITFTATEPGLHTLDFDKGTVDGPSGPVPTVCELPTARMANRWLTGLSAVRKQEIRELLELRFPESATRWKAQRLAAVELLDELDAVTAERDQLIRWKHEASDLIVELRAQRSAAYQHGPIAQAHAAGFEEAREAAVRVGLRIYDNEELDGALACVQAIRQLKPAEPQPRGPSCPHPARSTYQDDDGEWHCESCERALGR